MFINRIPNLCEEDIRNITILRKRTKMEANMGDANCTIAVESAQEFVVGNDKS